jgi:hypothetical protein
MVRHVRDFYYSELLNLEVPGRKNIVYGQSFGKKVLGLVCSRVQGIGNFISQSEIARQLVQIPDSG